MYPTIFTVVLHSVLGPYYSSTHIDKSFNVLHTLIGRTILHTLIRPFYQCKHFDLFTFIDTYYPSTHSDVSFLPDTQVDKSLFSFDTFDKSLLLFFTLWGRYFYTHCWVMTTNQYTYRPLLHYTSIGPNNSSSHFDRSILTLNTLS